MSAFGGIADIVLAGPGGDQKNRNVFEPDRGAARLLLIAYTDKLEFGQLPRFGANLCPLLGVKRT